MRSIELTTEQIAKVAGVSRKSDFNYRDKVERGGVAELLTRVPRVVFGCGAALPRISIK